MKKVLCLFFLSFALMLTACGSGEEEVKKTEIKIKENGVYSVPSNPTDLQAKLFNKLTKALSKNDEEATAVLVARNFVADFFTLKNKDDASNVGGLTYIPDSYQEKFRIFATSYVYAQYPLIVDEYGKASLPVVSKVTSDNVEAKTFDYTKYTAADETAGTSDTYEDITVDGYAITISIEYESTKVSDDDLKVNLVVNVINLDGKLVVVSIE